MTTTQQLREAHRDIARRYDDERQAFIARKRSDVEAAGGRVLRAYPALGRIRAEMSGPEIDALLPELRRVDVAKVDGGSADNADMEFIREGHQLDQFIDNGFKGDRYPGGGDEYHMAFWEGGSDTPADMDMLYDGAALAVSRYLATLCFAAPCALANDASQHPNRVLSVAVGDLTQGQDSAVTDATEQINKSGIALEANASYYVGGWAAAAAQMLIDASLYEVAVANTAGGATGSPTCQGNDADAIAADQLFEAGLFVVGGAGNDGDSTECNVHQPKDAIGVFTTAGSEPGTNSAEGVRDATFHTSSSVGGVKGSFNNSGRGRTIIDMTFTFGFTDRPNWDGTSYGNSVGGNSLTGPAVAAAAVDFADWFETGYGSTSLLGQPGKLFAAMLLMGDRTVNAGRQLNQFDRKWGAGLLKMRKLDSTGLDEPWQWGLSSVCVGDGESIYFRPGAQPGHEHRLRRHQGGAVLVRQPDREQPADRQPRPDPGKEPGRRQLVNPPQQQHVLRQQGARVRARRIRRRDRQPALALAGERSERGRDLCRRSVRVRRVRRAARAPGVAGRGQ